MNILKYSTSTIINNMAPTKQDTAVALSDKRKNPLTMKQGDFNYLNLFLHHQTNLQRIIINVVTAPIEQDRAVLSMPSSKYAPSKRKIKTLVKKAA